MYTGKMWTVNQDCVNKSKRYLQASIMYFFSSSVRPPYRHCSVVYRNTCWDIQQRTAGSHHVWGLSCHCQSSLERDSTLFSCRDIKIACISFMTHNMICFSQAVWGEAGKPPAEDIESYCVVPPSSWQPQSWDGNSQALPHPQTGSHSVR